MIIHGLVNMEIKQRVLSRTGYDELPTLAELVNYIAAEEISCSESLSPSPTLSATSDRENLPTRKIKENATSVEAPDTPAQTLLKTDRSYAKLSGRFVLNVAVTSSVMPYYISYIYYTLQNINTYN